MDWKYFSTRKSLLLLIFQSMSMVYRIILNAIGLSQMPITGGLQTLKRLKNKSNQSEIEKDLEEK